VARAYSTVADELREHADCVADYFEALGWTVKVEPQELGYPYTPTFRCRRPPTVLLVEVYASIRAERMRAWAGYAKSRNTDTRIAVALPRDAPRGMEDDAKLRDAGIGLYLSEGDRAIEVIAPMDMAVNVELPELKTLPPKMRKALGPAYEQFKRSQWREGFEDACQALEAHTRAYLATGIASGRISLVAAKGRSRTLTPAQIDRMTLGQLAEAFERIQNQNYADATVGKVLALVNKDRVGVVHHKRKSTTEARLRRNVGKHMWNVVAALKELV
jgi:hypothetical protein